MRSDAGNGVCARAGQQRTDDGIRIEEVKEMWKKIYQELVAIRKELQAIRRSLESLPEITFDREPYGRSRRVLLRPRCKDQ